MLKKLLVILIYFMIFSCSGEQDYTGIDLLLKKAETAKKNNKDLELLRYSTEANKLAKRADNSERIARSHYYTAMALYLLDMKHESLQHIRKAQAESYTKTDKALLTLLYELKSMNYAELKLYDISIRESDKIISLIPHTETDIELIETLSSALSHKGTAYYYQTEKLDSVKKYLDMELQLLQSKPEKLVFESLSQTYLNKSSSLDTNDKDALRFIDLSYNLRKKYSADMLFYDIWFAYGDHYFDLQELEKALEYYHLGLDEIRKKGFRDMSYTDIYKQVSDIYKILGNEDKEKEYLQIYAAETERLLKIHQQNAAAALKFISDEKEEEHRFLRSSAGIIVISLILIFLIVLMVASRNKKRKQKLLNDKDSLIQEIEQKAELLQNKVNDSFDEVILMAKSNNNQFWAKFQEVYPDFRPRILKINPDLKQSELILCAYLFLGFNTKDIADYTFKAIKTIKNNKYNLRKRLNVPTKDDLIVWIRNQMDS